MPPPLNRDSILELARSYQPACILAAAVDLDVFNLIVSGASRAEAIAGRAGSDPRATTVLLDALAVLGLLEKSGGAYGLPAAVRDALTDGASASALGMARHQANCLRRWAELPWVVKSGRPPQRRPSLGGPDADQASFIQAMDDVSAPVAAGLIAKLEGIRFHALLDIGGASGTWTIAWLQAGPGTRAILFDLAPVIPMARARLRREGMEERVALVAGDYNAGELPAGADLAWVSAIVHQNSPQQNRSLYARVFTALAPGGTVLIRDMVMEPSRVEPVAGALFAVNMLVGTEGGGTYTFDEMRADLESAGFMKVEWIHRDPGMHSVIRAVKPTQSP
jgi:precorrin-6B methylase 2